MEKGSRANSTREVPRWRGEEYQSRTKKVHWGPGVRDTREKTPESNSSAMVNRKKRDSISSHSGGSYKSDRRSGAEAPSKLQKINETSKVRFLTAEEVIKRCIGAPTSSHVDFPSERDYLSSSRGSSVVDKAHAPKSSALATIATPVASDSRQSSSSYQHQAFWRSESTEYEEAPTSSHVDFPTETGYLSSSRGSPIVDKAHAPKSSALAKIATPVASDSRQSSYSNQHQAFWRSESTVNEEDPTSSHVVFSTERDYLSSSRGSPIVDKAHAPKSSTLAKIATTVASDSRQSSSSNQHQAFWRSESTVNEEDRISSHVDFPIERDYLSSSRGSPIVDKAHASKSFVLAKIATPVASDSRQSSSSNQHQASWRSESTENEEVPPGFSGKKSTVGEISIPRPRGAENNPRKQLSSDGQDERDSRLVFSGISSESGPDCALNDVPPRNTAHVFRKRRLHEQKFLGTEVSLSRMDTKHEDCGLDAALSEELEGSCKKHEGGVSDAVMPEKLDGPNRRTNLVNDPAGVKFKAGPSSDCNVGQERNLQRNLPNSLKYPQKGPALKYIWKGNFEVLDIGSDVRRYEGILAHPSAKIARKAYDLTKQIAGALQFVMHPRHDFWPEMFQTDSPDRNDIALYFYPGKHERSKRQYSFLLKLIEKEDMVLRSSIGNVQLLVYPSKLLQADVQKLDGSYFMWGVFCGPNGSKVVFKAGALPSSSPTVA